MFKGTLNPFGDPDGARGNLAEILPRFVEFEDPSLWGGLSISPDDRRTRLIIGRKGSGKTIYLRRLRASASDASDLFAVGLEHRPPDTDDVIRFASKMSSSEVVEMWSIAWNRAVLRSLTSHVLNTRQLADHLSKELRTSLREDFSRLLKNEPPYRTPLTVYGELSNILSSHTTRNGYKSYLSDPLWYQLEGTLSKHLRQLPPIFFYLDNVDENFEKAPAAWRDCQLGLFHAVLNLLRDHRLGSRLHVTASLRDIVFLKALEGEHETRFLADTYIRILDWNWRAAQFFLVEKVKRLSSVRPGASLGVESILQSWLSLLTVENSNRKVDEPILQYFLRHTRLLPRDIIILGNKVCHEIESARWFDPEWSKSSASYAVSRAVHYAARHFGKEQLRISSHHIAAEIGGQIDNSQQVEALALQVRAWLKKLGRDRFRQKAFLEFSEQGDELFGGGEKAIRALWLNGLLGYVAKRNGIENAVFYSDSHDGEYQIPFDRATYVLHSVLIDAVGIRATGKPVVQWSGG